MARLSNHEITETWRHNKIATRIYHVTKTGRVLMTDGPRGGGGAKLLYHDDNSPIGYLGFNFHGVGKHAHVDEYRDRLEAIATRIAQ